MYPSHALNLFMSPFLMWSQLAWKTGEMAIASAQVIGYRTNRLMVAGVVPGGRDQREFALMGHEKGAAALESAQAMGPPMLMLTQQFATLAFKQMQSTSEGLISIAASRTPAESVERQAKLVRDSMRSSVVSTSKLSGSTAKIARSAVKPVHTRVSGNLKRLSKQK